MTDSAVTPMAGGGGGPDALSQTLEWDTRFLGRRVAKIVAPALALDRIAALLQRLRADQVELVYWPAVCEVDDRLIRSLGGRLVDRKRTYVADLSRPDAASASDVPVAPFATGMSTERLEVLAVQSAVHSRFAVDPRMPPGTVERLYRTWMRRSLSGELARIVLVTVDTGAIAGMITVDANGAPDGADGRAGGQPCEATIGLVAVDATARGRGHGRALVGAAKTWARDHALASIRVVTQGANVEACRLYERSGFTLEREEAYYHFWL